MHRAPRAESAAPSWWRLLVLGASCCAVCIFAGCPGPAGRPAGVRLSSGKLTVKLIRFDGRKGVFRIHNASRQTVRRVAVGLRGVGCKGPRPTRTTVQIFDLRLRAGEGRSFAFRLDSPCRKAYVAIATP